MSGQERLTISRGIERIVTIKQGASVVELRQSIAPRVSVVSLGVQGPVGALAENVLQRTMRAELDARTALELATSADSTVSALLDDLKGVFIYHAGAISAQGG